MIKEKKSPQNYDGSFETESEYSLILFNDDYNTFEFVIETLVQVCDHIEEQAYQCALITHHKGKCEVKKGTMGDLKQRCYIMLSKGLSVEIVSNS